MLARRSATILEALIFVATGNKDNLPNLVTRENCGYITYPNLKGLAVNLFSGVDGMDPIQYHIYADMVIPFPNLEYIRLEGNYMLGYDVLFRSNHHSLQVFFLVLSSHIADILINSRVFTTGKYRELEHVKIILNTMAILEYTSLAPLYIPADTARLTQNLRYRLLAQLKIRKRGLPDVW